MEKKGVGRPRDGNPEETRQQILRAAGEAFAASGFVGATTRSVAARAGVNVATLHYHFGSKEGLYRAVLALAARGPLPEVPEGTGPESVARLVEALLDFSANRPGLARLALLDALAGPRPAAGRSPDGRVAWLAGALRERLGPPSDPADAPPEETARAIVTLVDAALVAGAASNDGDPEPPQALPPEAVRRAVVAAAVALTRRG